MNERIRELAEQAGLLYKQFGPTVETRYMKKKEQDLEKFAELIVQECGVALSPMLRDMISRGQAHDLIKEHFGIKESKREQFDKAMREAFKDGVDLSGKETP